MIVSHYDNVMITGETFTVIAKKIVPAAGGKRAVDLITHVRDRLGHDRRYAINYARAERELRSLSRIFTANRGCHCEERSDEAIPLD